jgi:hypothetical protein
VKQLSQRWMKLTVTLAIAFVCPVESCARSFSVLSNMRRHARVHSQIPAKQPEPSSDEESERSATSHDPIPRSATSMAFNRSYGEVPQHKWQRRDSGASTSSDSSRHSYSSDEDPITRAHSEKRLRGRPEQS